MITSAQAAALLATVRKRLDWYQRVKDQMDALGVPESDALYQSVCRVVISLGDVARQAEIIAGQVKHRRGKGEREEPRPRAWRGEGG